MCNVCQKAKKRMRTSTPLNEIETRSYLDSIAAAIASGAKAEHFQAVLDEILGTAMTEADPELDAAWERGRRRRG